MSVDDWARREAERRYPALVRGEDERYDDFDARLNERDVAADAFADGIVRAFDALLSDEAVEAAEDEQYRHGRDLVFGGGCACGEPFPLMRQGIRAHDLHVIRAALQAAIDAVTKEARND